MHPPEVLLKRAAECERMAESTRDPGSKAAWRRMAERWHLCAEVAMSASLAAAHHGRNRHRKPAPGWATIRGFRARAASVGDVVKTERV
jgi:hypothetical protein